MIPFADWQPDISDYNGKTSQFAQNVVPRKDGYGPFPSPAAYSQPLLSGNDSFTKVYLTLNGTNGGTTFTDTAAGATVAHTWSAVGNAQTSTAQFKLGGSSLLLDGTNDAITMPDNVDITLGAQKWTIDGWYLAAGNNGTQMEMGGQCDSAGNLTSMSFQLSRLASNKLFGRVGIGAVGHQVIGATDVVVADGWVHVAFTCDGTNLFLFRNGILDGKNTSYPGGTINDSSNLLGIGQLGEFVGLTEWFGNINSWRMSVGVARYTCPSTTAIGTQVFQPPLALFDTAANGRCRGLFYAQKTDGSVVVFGATATRLFKLNTIDNSWIDLSKGGVAYSPVPNTDQWQAIQFGNIVIFVQANTVPQAVDISTNNNFADLGGSPPQARYISVVGKFVVLSGLTSLAFRIQWSGLNAITTWTSGVNFSDFQDFPDGGIVRGVAGGEYGVIFQDRVIRSMIYAIGATYVFQITRISEDRGLLAPYSIIRSGGRIFFLASQGFHMIENAQPPVAIGKEKFDRTFLGDYDSSNLQLVIGAPDPQSTRVFWAYKSKGGVANHFDKLLTYDHELKRATVVVGVVGQYISTLAAPGGTLEGLDIISSSIDLLPFSLDDVALSALPKIVMVDSSARLSFFSGTNLEATMDTAEQKLSGKRVRVHSFEPITDAPTVFGSIGTRERLQNTVAYSLEQALTIRGSIPANISTQYARARIRIPAGTTWTYASGIEPMFKAEGRW